MRQEGHLLVEPPAQQLHQLLQTPAASQLLQQPPPGAVVSADQDSFVASSRYALCELGMQAGNSYAPQEQQHQAACSVFCCAIRQLTVWLD
jgi:hypothetical protein